MEPMHWWIRVRLWRMRESLMEAPVPTWTVQSSWRPSRCAAEPSVSWQPQGCIPILPGWLTAKAGNGERIRSIHTLKRDRSGRGILCIIWWFMQLGNRTDESRRIPADPWQTADRMREPISSLEAILMYCRGLNTIRESRLYTVSAILSLEAAFRRLALCADVDLEQNQVSYPWFQALPGPDLQRN